MYLISLNDWDYIWITAFLAISFVIAYSFRRKNPSSDSFLFKTTKIESVLPFLSNFGLVEIILGGIAGAYLGFNAIYYVVLAIILQHLGQIVLCRRYQEIGGGGLNDYIGQRSNHVFAIMVAVLNVLFLICCVSLAVTVAFKALQAIMGWGFINNIMGLFGLTVVFILIGGRAAVMYNKLLSSILLIATFVIAISLAFVKLGGLNKIISNLNNLAAAQELPNNHYFWLSPDHHTKLVILAIVIGFAGFKLIGFSTKPCQTSRLSLFGRIGMAVIYILPGIIAIATPSSSGIPGKDIVTVMAQLPDGQTGYVVKAIDNHASKHGSSSPGIIPPLLNPKSNLLEKGQYNYSLASIVMLKHYLPPKAVVLIVLVLLAGFMIAIGNYMLRLSQITVNNILLPLNWIAKYGKIGELWSLQVSIVSFTGITLLISYFLFLHYDLLLFVSVILVLMIFPLTLLILLILVKAFR